MLVLALLVLLNWIMVLTHFLTINDPALVSIALLDLTLLVYGWTSPSETWLKRRNNRKSFFVMVGISVVLVTACVVIFAQVQF